MKEVPLTKGQVALVDDADYERVMQHKWYAASSNGGRRFYPARKIETGLGYVQPLAAFVLELPRGALVDHVDRNAYNNQRSNLRQATRVENNRNRSKQVTPTVSRYIGVTKYITKPYKWKASISYNGRKIHLGTFVIEEDAARAYDAAARKYFGEFANPNFPDTN